MKKLTKNFITMILIILTTFNFINLAQAKELVCTVFENEVVIILRLDKRVDSDIIEKTVFGRAFLKKYESDQFLQTLWQLNELIIDEKDPRYNKLIELSKFVDGLCGDGPLPLDIDYFEFPKLMQETISKILEILKSALE